jgi:hypothetical protein
MRDKNQQKQIENTQTQKQNTTFLRDVGFFLRSDKIDFILVFRKPIIRQND